MFISAGPGLEAGLNVIFLLAVQLALAPIGGLMLYLVGAWGRPAWRKAIFACLVALAIITCGMTLGACIEGRAKILGRPDLLSAEKNLEFMWQGAGLSLCLAAATVGGGWYLRRLGQRHRPEFRSDVPPR